MIESKNEQNDQTLISDDDQIGEEIIIDDLSEIKWTLLEKDEVIPIKIIPKIEAKSLLPIKGDEFEILSFFLPNEFWEKIVVYTNEYANDYLERPDIKVRLKEKKFSKLHRWKPVTVSQIQRYVGIILLMGHVRLPAIKGNISGI